MPLINRILASGEGLKDVAKDLKMTTRPWRRIQSSTGRTRHPPLPIPSRPQPGRDSSSDHLLGL